MKYLEWTLYRADPCFVFELEVNVTQCRVSVSLSFSHGNPLHWQQSNKKSSVPFFYRIFFCRGIIVRLPC